MFSSFITCSFACCIPPRLLAWCMQLMSLVWAIDVCRCNRGKYTTPFFVAPSLATRQPGRASSTSLYCFQIAVANEDYLIEVSIGRMEVYIVHVCNLCNGWREGLYIDDTACCLRFDYSSMQGPCRYSSTLLKAEVWASKLLQGPFR